MTAAETYARNQDRADRMRAARDRFARNIDIFVWTLAAFSIIGAIGWIIIPAFLRIF